jgi:tetratricopeptide (TPR) repeat protein
MMPSTLVSRPIRTLCRVLLAFALPLVAVTALLCLRAQPATAQPAPAQDTRAPEARALFQQGLAFADQNRWSEAAERFAQALALRDSPVIAYNLGSALRQLRRWVEACELFARVSQATSAAPELRRSAATAHAELIPRLGHLTLHVQGHQPDDVILLDRRPLAPDQLELAISIDPGAHQLAVLRGDRTLHSETVLVFEGASRELILRLLPDPQQTARLSPGLATPRPSPAPAVPLHGPDAAEASDTPWWVWAGAGTLVAGAITAATILLLDNDSPTPEPGDSVLFLKRRDPR